jgi:hypothetical protein
MNKMQKKKVTGRGDLQGCETLRITYIQTYIPVLT